MSDAELVWKLVGALALVLTIAVAWKKVFYPNRIAQPFEVSTAKEWVSRHEAAVCQANFDQRLATLERRFDAHLVDVKADIADLHEKLNTHHGDIMRALGRLEGQG
jgi:hypothetical protein